MTAKTIEFNRDRASQYDLDIRKAIPGYEALHGMAQSLLSTSLPPSASLLVIGSGTGMELINFCQHHPQWSLTGVEPSPEMMTLAQQAIGDRGFLERVNLHTGYLDTLPKSELMDAATLMLVMHFLKDDGSKLNLLQNIAKRLKPGAELILADLYGDISVPYFADFRKAWQSLYFSQLDEATKIKAEQNFEASINNSIYFVTEARMIELLNTAGFNHVTRFYTAFLFGGWTAKYTGN
jgi:tRNA (cmo5U34)-methyltransferase